MADLDEVAALLHVYEKASAHGDLLKNIANSAMGKLRAIDAEHVKPAEAVAEPEPAPEPDPVVSGVTEPEHEPEDEPDAEHEVEHEEEPDHAA